MGLGCLFNLLINLIAISACCIFIFILIKRGKKWIAVIPAIVIVVIIARMWYFSGSYLSTGVKNNNVYVIGTGTGSMGSGARYEIYGDDILEEAMEYNKGNYTSIKLVFGWKFVPKSSGSCEIHYIESNCGQWLEPVIYKVDVDDNLQVSMTLSDNRK